MHTRPHIKHKILLLIILGVAAGFILLLPHKNVINKISQITPNVSEKKDVYTNCEGPKNAYAKILAQHEIDLTDKTCLYVGCGGFIY